MSTRTRCPIHRACVGLLAALILALLDACVAMNPVDPSSPTAVPTAVVSSAPAPTALPSIDLPPDQQIQPIPPVVPTPNNSTAPTTVVEYVPARPDGEARPGSCWTNSLAVPSRDAWRCRVDSQVLDPCFVLGVGEVVCNPNPLTTHAGILVKLSEPLPRPDLIAEKASRAWQLELEDRTICNLATGATGIVSDKRITYVCSVSNPKETERVVILGEPRSGTTWTVERATLALRDGTFVVSESATLPLRAIVRGPAAFVPYTCAPLADALSEILGADVQRSEASFIDPTSGASGTGCQATTAGAQGDLQRPPADLVHKMLTFRGWQEDTRYQSVGVGQSASAFRRANALCLLNTGSAPAREAYGAAPALIQRDQHTVTLNCAQDRSIAGAAETSPGEPERILFDLDATSGLLRRAIVAGEIQEYVLWAFAGQTMIVDVTSPRSDVFLSVSSRSDSMPLLRPTANARHWQGTLPATQDYVLRAAARGEDAEYSLRVVVPVALEIAPEVRSVVALGELKPNQTMYYLFSGTTGQRLTIGVTSPQRHAFLAVAGLEDGQSLSSSESQVTSWTGRLSRTQEYLVEVISDDALTEYALEIAVEP